MNRLRVIRYVTWAVAVVAVAAVGVVSYLLAQRSESPDAVAIGGPFTLVSQAGDTVTEADLRGHPSLMFFGYTWCPDVCPTALAEATAWLETLGPEAADLAVYFVTVDPARDTPEQVARYLTAFDPRIVGLTGPVEEVEAMLRSFRVYFRKVEPEDGSDRYLMDHGASFYLFDAEAQLAGLIDYNATAEEALAKLRKLLAET